MWSGFGRAESITSMTPVAPVCSHPSLPSCQGTLTPAIPEVFFFDVYFAYTRCTQSSCVYSLKSGRGISPFTTFLGSPMADMPLCCINITMRSSNLS